MSLLQRTTDPLFWTPPADEHPRSRYTPGNTPRGFVDQGRLVVELDATVAGLRHVHDAPLDRFHHPFGREGEASRAHAECVERVEARAWPGEDAGATLGCVCRLAISIEHKPTRSRASS